jgi:ABC-type taurine transport system ATPase subunit
VEADAGAGVRACRDGLRKGRENLANDVPATAVRPEPEGLYRASSEDGLLRRLAKAGVRAVRTVTGTFGSAGPREQTVPLGRRVGDHATGRLAEAHAPLADEIEQRLAAWVVRLERTASDWIHGVLEAERLLEEPGFYARGAGEPAPDPGEAPSSPSNGAAGGPDVDPERLLEDVRSRGQALEGVLADGADLAVDDFLGRFEAAADRARDALAGDVDAAGTFMDARRPASGARLRRRRTERRHQSRAWADWHRQAADRLGLAVALSEARTALCGHQKRLFSEVLAASLSALEGVQARGADTLEAIADEAKRRFEEAPAGRERNLLVDIDDLADRAIGSVEQTLLGGLRDLAVRRRSVERIEREVEQLRRVLDEQPETFTVHPFPEDEGPIDPRVDPLVVQWHEITRETLDGRLFEAWRAAAAPLAGAAESALARAEEVQQVVSFNLGAAIEELQALVAERRDRQRGGSEAGQGPPEAARSDEANLASARELVLEGLSRSADLLRTAEAPLGGLRRQFAEAAGAAGSQAWMRLYERARASGRAREYVLRAQDRAADRLQEAATALRRQVRGLSLRTRRALRLGRRRAAELVRLGQTAVGVAAADPRAREETVAALSSVDAVLQALPAVYRRLFSFRPVQDPNLLVAREDDLQAVRRHLGQWMQGAAPALVVTGPAGSGRTSLLNVLRRTALREVRRHDVSFDARVGSEAAFVERVAQALGLPGAADEGSLDALAERLQAAPVPERGRVCVVENLEHTYLRAVGGTDLAARVLRFFSETDAQVLWLATCSSSAWQALEAYEPVASGLVDRHELDAFDREEMEELVMRRHRRSGYRLVFDRPDEGSAPLLTRRLQVLAGSEERQALLRQEFFDRLYALCGQNVMLALFYWFRAVALDPDEPGDGVLHVRPLQPIRFEYLDALSLPHAFALKALMDHRSLTAGELAAVLQEDEETARALLASLGNALLIAPVGASERGRPARVGTIDRGTSYRVRPLVVHPVIRFLRSRNILH